MATMRKLLAIVYGVAVYALFGVTWVYFIGFLGGFVPKNVDSGAVVRPSQALAIDVACLALFFAHHSVLARVRAKAAIARFIAPAVERSTYVLVASLAMVLLIAMWRPMPQAIWQTGGAVRVATLVVFWAGVLISIAGSHTIDGLALFGVRQVFAYFRGRVLPELPFRTPGLYRLVRHPMMTGLLMALWAAPTMTQGRLLLATAMTGYILAAVKWLEERDLRRAFGTAYEGYQRNVPMLIPMKLRPRAPAVKLESERAR
jgi:protein-S-isoprenylcysteine O-methyltransferase Ste14